jgi:hypothetical protein
MPNKSLNAARLIALKSLKEAWLLTNKSLSAARLITLKSLKEAWLITGPGHDGPG